MYGGTDFMWLSQLLGNSSTATSATANATPNLTLGSDPSTWAPQTMAPPLTPPMGAGMNPEMGGGTARQVGQNTVDALGYFNNNVNTASAVAAGREPTFADKFKDFFGIDGPNERRNLGLLLAAGMLTPMMFAKGGRGGEAPRSGPMQDFSSQVAPLQRQRPQLPRYPWSQPRGLLSE